MKNQKTHFFDNPTNVNLLIRLFFGTGIVLLIVDIFIHKHGHYHIEDYVGLYAFFGFAACGLILYVSKLIGKFICRKEDYYD